MAPFPSRSALWILPSYLDLVPIWGQLIGPCRVNSLHKCSHTILSQENTEGHWPRGSENKGHAAFQPPQRHSEPEGNV